MNTCTVPSVLDDWYQNQYYEFHQTRPSVVSSVLPVYKYTQAGIYRRQTGGQVDAPQQRDADMVQEDRKTGQRDADMIQ